MKKSSLIFYIHTLIIFTTVVVLLSVPRNTYAESHEPDLTIEQLASVVSALDTLVQQLSTLLSLYTKEVSASAHPTTGLIGYWDFNEVSGNALDGSGLGNTGTLQGDTSRVIGQTGFSTALSFDGTGDYVDINPVGNDVNTAEGTFAAWVKFSSTAVADGVQDAIVGVEADKSNFIYLSLDAKNRMSLVHKVNGGTDSCRMAGFAAYGDQWTHVAGVWGANNLYCYINGVLEKTVSKRANITATFNKAYIGADIVGAITHYLDGQVDDVRIYNRALSTSEITTLYNHVPGGSTSPPPPPSDTTPPTISITTPSSGATVSASTAVSANATDNIGVVGVQFKLDGVNLGAEDTVSPYSINWNTTTATNGTHSLTAVARDAAGNTTTSAGITVTVSNIISSDTTPPSTPTGLSATAVSSSQINLSWSASTDNIGVTSYKVYRGGVFIATVTGTTHNNTGLSANTAYSYTVSAVDAAGNESGQSVSVSATTQSPPPSSPLTLIPTFESISVYWAKPDSIDGTTPATVRYRRVGDVTWKNALDLWYDGRTCTKNCLAFMVDNQYRGSIVHVISNTNYEVEVNIGGIIVSNTVRTWNEDFPIAQTIFIEENRQAQLDIVGMHGSPTGYILYTHEPGKTSTIDANNLERFNIFVSDSSYIIIRDLILKGAQEDGIFMDNSVNNIVVENNDISGWGTIASDATEENPFWGITKQAAVKLGGAKGNNINKIIIQRNKMHNPRTDTNSWAEYRTYKKATFHPLGPQAITPGDIGGNIVIRYNEIYSDFDHMLNDCIGGGTNDGWEGTPGRDSDIYGNNISHCWDDAIQAEGGGMNVRIWGNFIDESLSKIAVAPVSLGPTYIWRNVFNKARRDDEGGYGQGTAFKTGGGPPWIEGRTYIFHNLALQDETLLQGIGKGIISSGGKTFETIVRNNIVMNSSSGDRFWVDNTSSCTNDLNYDLYNGTIKHNCASRPHEQNGIKLAFGTWPQYKDVANGDYSLLPGTPGHDAGIALANFNDGYEGSAPDMGAQEAGTAPIQFGVNAYRGVPWGTSGGSPPPPPPAPQCSDGIDNDSDGLVDFPNDPGCTSSSDDDETDTQSPPPPPSSIKFSVGDRVITTDDLNVRSTPTISGTLLGTQLNGSLGFIIVGGPVAADGFIWWNVDYDDNSQGDGWSVENWLEITVVSPPPPSSDTTPPSTPTGLSATAVSSSQINLSWSASTDNIGVTSYKVYRGGVFITTVTGTTDSDIGLSANTTYSYTVSAVDAAGNESGQSVSTSATTQSPSPFSPTLIPTFHSMSIEWPVTAGTRAYATFVPVGSGATPTQSLDFAYDAIADEYRGSLLFLTPDTNYDIRLFRDGVQLATAVGKTWKEGFTCGQTIEVPTGLQSAPLTINGVHGTPNAYVCYVPAPGGDGTLDAKNINNSVIISDSTYVIVRGFKFVNAQKQAFVFSGAAPVNNIVIEDNEITNWGQINDLSGFAEADNGINTSNGDGVNFGRLIIQRNRIHDPRGGSNSWEENRLDRGCKATDTRCHPWGAKAISLRNSSGNNVIRHNEITGSEGHYFMDGIGGSANDSYLGAPGANSDIYGNIVTYVRDDAIEVEGGGENIRIWGNLINHALTAFATAPTRLGPLYIVRNVVLDTHGGNPDGSGTFIKTDSGPQGKVGGRQFVLHNTIVGSLSRGISGTGRCLVGIFSRNNIIPSVNKAYSSERDCFGLPNDIDFDLYTGEAKNVTVGPNMIFGTATYENLNVSYALAPGTPGSRDGEVLPNMPVNNDGTVDRGAQLSDAPLMVFGIAASNAPPPPLLPPPPPPGADTTPPTFSNINSSVTTSSATVTWSTNEGATSQVDYGLSTTYGSQSPLDTVLISSHTATLSNLSAGTLYHFRVRSTDAAGNTSVSLDRTFTTTAAPDTQSPNAVTNFAVSNVDSTSAVPNVAALEQLIFQTKMHCKHFDMNFQKMCIASLLIDCYWPLLTNNYYSIIYKFVKS